ncbi:hypothetical protein [Sulfurovum riftiae]|uniref:Glycosyltransferase RgtA/B/C/D-like domain-containing protein n=1 Tax=Sulfurovum riftiae TaxID=1630136 RepID=A0A151CD64_9BACT|nr:hypothetical protein [Sulfurovum riftiae]KYJ85471.1 hypothetical protein AS592_03925 [Sulfurovum riftiae]
MQQIKDWKIFIIIALTVLALVFVIWSFNGHWPTEHSPYNTYAIQAQAWINGKITIENYSHLELAFYHDNVYVSFPPFPSFIMLPFVAIWGLNTPDNFIGLFFGILGIFYSYKLARNFINSVTISIFLAFFLTLSSNYIFLIQNGWVWFFAQTLSFTFTIMAFYYATKKDTNFYLAFLFLAFAIGCRPFQILYGFLLLYLLLKKTHSLKQILFYILPAILVGFTYALYNYIRFDSFIEFGHNYLPEMTDSKYGQFHIYYVADNIKKLFLIPNINTNGIMNYPKFNGFSIFLLNPIITVTIILFVFYIISLLFRKEQTASKNILFIAFVVLSTIVLHTLLICMHITMGGWQWGNRYIIDTLPAFFLLLCFISRYIKINWLYFIPFFIYGLVLNTIGITLFYLGKS